MKKRAYTSPEAAHYCGYSDSYFRQSRMQSEGARNLDAPKFTRLGNKKVVYLIEDLDEWLDSHRIAMSGDAV